MTYRDRPWPEGGPGGHMDPHTAPCTKSSSSTNATAEVALRRAQTLTSITAWSGFSRQEIDAIIEHARRKGAEQERKRIFHVVDTLFSQISEIERTHRAAGRMNDAERHADFMEGIARVIGRIYASSRISEEVDDG